MSISFGGGSSRHRQQATIPPPTPEEDEARAIQLQLARRQLAAWDRAQAEDEAWAKSPQGINEKKLQALATQQLLDRLEGRRPVLSAEAEQRIGTQFDLAKRRGTESLQQATAGLAGMRGLRPTDTPIGGDYLKQQGEFLQGLEASRAGSELDVGQTEALFNQQLAQFTAELQQQAFNNRMTMAGGNASPSSQFLMQNLFGQRMAAAPHLSWGSQSGNQWGGGLADIGRLAQGAGALGWNPFGGGRGVGNV